MCGCLTIARYCWACFCALHSHTILPQMPTNTQSEVVVVKDITDVIKSLSSEYCKPECVNTVALLDIVSTSDSCGCLEPPNNVCGYSFKVVGLLCFSSSH